MSVLSVAGDRAYIVSGMGGLEQSGDAEDVDVTLWDCLMHWVYRLKVWVSWVGQVGITQQDDSNNGKLILTEPYVPNPALISLSFKE